MRSQGVARGKELEVEVIPQVMKPHTNTLLFIRSVRLVFRIRKEQARSEGRQLCPGGGMLELQYLSAVAPIVGSRALWRS